MRMLLFWFGLSSLFAPVAPAAASEDPETVWQYLCRKYDKDHNDQIAPGEYDRGQDAFTRLDRDRDGVLSTADFEREAANSGSPSPEELRHMMKSTGTAVLIRYLSEDEQDGLARGELERRFEALDTDADGLLTREEFQAEIDRRGVGPYRMMGRDRFDFLAGGADGDADAKLSKGELGALFDSQDADADGVLAGDEVPEMSQGRGGPGDRRGGRGSRESRGEGEADDSRTAVGKVAPDFTLGDLDGTLTVTLSSHAGKKPVALIFGSFT